MENIEKLQSHPRVIIGSFQGGFSRQYKSCFFCFHRNKKKIPSQNEFINEVRKKLTDQPHDDDDDYLFIIYSTICAPKRGCVNVHMLIPLIQAEQKKIVSYFPSWYKRIGILPEIWKENILNIFSQDSVHILQYNQ